MPIKHSELRERERKRGGDRQTGREGIETEREGRKPGREGRDRERDTERGERERVETPFSPPETTGEHLCTT